MDWWINDPRYGTEGWTLVRPAGGGRPYFVKAGRRPRRAKPRALRFGKLQVGDVLVHRATSRWTTRPSVGDLKAANEVDEKRDYAGFYIVEHRWFDPCAGHDDPVAGEMAGVCRISHDGKVPHPQSHTLRGLAQQGYHYATDEQADDVRSFIAERDRLRASHAAGELSADETRLRARPYRELVRGLA